MDNTIRNTTEALMNWEEDNGTSRLTETSRTVQGMPITSVPLSGTGVAPFLLP